MSNLKPLYDRVVVKPVEAEEKSAGGILIPDNAKEKPTKGEVVAVGEGKALDNGSVRAPKVKVGDQVKTNDIVVEIETAKSLVELPIPFAGTVVELLVEIGRAHV